MAGAALIAWLLIYMRPMAAMLLPWPARTPLLVSLTGAGLGVGLATLVPFWLMMLAPGSPVFPTTLIVTVIVAAVGVALRRTRAGGDGRVHRDVAPGATTSDGLWWLHSLLGATVALVAAGILFNAVFWPFDNGDALALYAPFGRHILGTRTLPEGEGFYEAYPMLVPIGFAFTGWAAGGANEYVARLFAAVLGVLSIVGAGALGAAVGPARLGWTAAALTATTPVFARWASTGYTDVPASLFAVLAALLAWEWQRLRATGLLVLAGVMVGLAAWTKNSALALVPSLALVVLQTTWYRPRSAADRVVHSLLALGAALGGTAAVAAPWYLRSLVHFGHAVPPTAYVDRARHDLGAFLLMLSPDQHFGLAGWIFGAGLIGALAAVAAAGVRRDVYATLLCWVGPFVLAWWWVASYETRFLMVVVPLLAVLGGVVCHDLGRWAARTLTDARPTARVSAATRGIAAALALVVVLAGVVSLRKAVEHKAALVRRPWPSDDERHRIRLGELWDLATLLKQQPPGMRLGGVPPILRYHLNTANTPVVTWGPIASPTGVDLPSADLFVFGPVGAVEAGGALVPLARVGESFRVFRAARTAQEGSRQ